MLITKISIQTDNHKYRKVVATKKVKFLKNGFEVSKNSTFFGKSFVYTKCLPFGVQWSIRPFWNK